MMMNEREFGYAQVVENRPVKDERARRLKELELATAWDREARSARIRTRIAERRANKE